MNARARVVGRFDRASTLQTATVLLERELGLFSVRVLHGRRLYTLPLATVAEMVCQRIIKAEVFAKRLAKAARRRGRR